MTYLTAELSGIGGQLKTTPEDFFVEEIPLYLPSGEGQHTYIEIEKRGLTTYEAIRRIANGLNISRNSIGYAGLKDAQAVTRQTLSLDGVTTDAALALDIPDLTILKATAHRNKLKLNHLKGNRFVLRVREVSQTDLPQAEKILHRLAETGVPNFFGTQRFGRRDNTHHLGEQVVRQDAAAFVTTYLGSPQPHEYPDVQAARQLVDDGQWEAALAQWPRNLLADERRLLAHIVQAHGELDQIFNRLPKKIKTFFISAFQSHLFNQLLSERLSSLAQLQTGDAAFIHQKGAAFIVEDVAVEQPRADAFEISPSGPLFGSKVLLAEGDPGQRERALLARYNLTLEAFKLPGLKIRGTRRPYRFQLTQPKIWWDDGLRVSFELPSGSYATTVMAEIMKPDG